jgi:hypothetical protein
LGALNTAISACSPRLSLLNTGMLLLFICCASESSLCVSKPSSC